MTPTARSFRLWPSSGSSSRKLEPDPNDPDKKIWVPDRRAVLRNKMKHANSLTGEGGVLAVLNALGVTSIVA